MNNLFPFLKINTMVLLKFVSTIHMVLHHDDRVQNLSHDLHGFGLRRHKFVDWILLQFYHSTNQLSSWKHLDFQIVSIV